MARNYPRFIYSSPAKTISQGPFVIHCLEPRFIAKIENNKLILLENWSNAPDEDLYAIMKIAEKRLHI